MDTLNRIQAAGASSSMTAPSVFWRENTCNNNKTMIPVTRTTKALYGRNAESNNNHHTILNDFMRSSSATQLQLLLFIFALLLFVSHLGCATATPILSVSSPGFSKEVAEMDQTVSGDAAAVANKQQQQRDESGASENYKQQVAGKSNTAEKLKRGLTNFMNQLNPAPFFVPAIVVEQTTSPKSGQSANLAPSSELATIVSSDSSLVLKSSANRWAFARPIGGPLRWGRR